MSLLSARMGVLGRTPTPSLPEARSANHPSPLLSAQVGAVGISFEVRQCLHLVGSVFAVGLPPASCVVKGLAGDQGWLGASWVGAEGSTV